MYWFTADEHYGHDKIIRPDYCNRPFTDSHDMNKTLIQNLNYAIGDNDTVIHAGDFSWHGKKFAESIIRQFRGNHIFLRGSHDKWLPSSARYIWQNKIDKQLIVVCHYAMRTWQGSRYGSWQLHGHSHGMLPPLGKQHDVGVDNNNFYPISFEQVKSLMRNKPNNYIEPGRRIK